ncbi:hypothetical protein [Paraburkholderia sp. SIMBA_027]|uniref:hypothetical protein n=1 Tax=Paraburkholderia sp. SIMBA_027 TaxID=3085770 RepID=UPI0039786778
MGWNPVGFHLIDLGLLKRAAVRAESELATQAASTQKVPATSQIATNQLASAAAIYFSQTNRGHLQMPSKNAEPTRPEPDEHPRENINQQAPSLPDWRHWRESGGQRMWQAVLLSLNVNATAKDRDSLKVNDPAKYAEYERRCKVAIARYGVHEQLPAIAHPMSGRMIRERYVLFDRFLAFARDVGWDGLEAFERGLGFAPVAALSDSTVGMSTEITKGWRYDRVRMGALLKLLEDVARGTADGKALLHGGQISLIRVGQEMANIIDEAAKAAAPGKRLAGYGADGNRKSLTAARDALKDV